MGKFEYSGDIDNWMDLRDEMIDRLKQCDTELKLDAFITNIFLSIAPLPKDINKTRRQLKEKTFNKEEVDELKRLFY